ncbi:hypothetical protein ABMA77_08765 [Halobacteriovorax sp. RZ-1]|uniref:5-methylcytosine restriction system specificity protein McrC n=1 Tax=unclassified Halobacteriovorax TaxID=2639665 RepID=UPI0037187E0A
MENEISFVASKLGKLSGLLIIGNSQRQLVILVRPKVWRSREDFYDKFINWRDEDKSCYIELFETQKFVIRFSDNSKVIINKLKEYQKIEDNNKEESNLLEEIALKYSTEDTFQKCKTQPVDLDKISYLLKLGYRGKVLTQKESTFANLSYDSPLLRILLFNRFIEELELNFKYIKKGYIEKKEELITIKGRVNESSLLESIEQKKHFVNCSYDDFDKNTLTVQLIKSATQIVNARLPWSSPFLDDDSKICLFKKSKIYFNFFRDVDVLTADKMMAMSERYILSKTNRNLRKLVELARMIVVKQDLKIGQPSKEIDSFCIKIRTDKLWENILYESLAKSISKNECVIDGNSNKINENFYVTCSPPWISSGTEEGLSPDLVLGLKHKKYLNFFCIDAKYKTKTSAIEDMRQMFVYSHLVKIRDKDDIEYNVKKLNLIYPSTNDYLNLKENLRSDNEEIKLYETKVKFPDINDIDSLKNWRRYIVQTGSELVSLLRGLITDN